MKLRYLLIIFIYSYSICAQFTGYEFNTGITTTLLSSSNCKPYVYGWQGWACGMNGTIIKSTSIYSSQWINVTGNGVPTNVNLTNIFSLDAQTAFVTGTLGSTTWVWKTTNGGANWFQVFTQQNGFINAIWMRNYSQGILEGNPVNGRWSLWKTTNGGNSWDSSGFYLTQSGNETGFPNSFCMYASLYPSSDSSRIWFGTDNSRIYYSSNYGQNWNVLSTPEQNSTCIMFNNIYMIPTLYFGGSNNLYKSTNYGSTWTNDSLPGSGSIAGVTCSYGAIVSARANKIYVKWGINWSFTYTSPSGNYKYVDNKGGDEWYDHYVVKDNGGITFVAEGEGIKKISTDIPSAFSLSQNYPNPFNPTTKIKFDISPSPLQKERGLGGEVKLTIYDILGREVATLVNEKLNAGSYEVEWDGNNYPSGVYFYKLSVTNPELVSGSNVVFSQTKKLILIK